MPRRRYAMPGASTEGEGSEPQDPKDGEGANPQDPQEGTKPQEGGEGEAEKAQDPATPEGETVNRHQYERDVQRRDKEIARLKAQLKAQNDDKAAEGDETAKLRQDFESMKAQLADERANTALTAAGCVDLELGRAALAKFDGDVAKLKESKPYLFKAQEKKVLSTGGKPAGGANTMARSIREGLAQK
jgi:hypothetical protein